MNPGTTSAAVQKIHLGTSGDAQTTGDAPHDDVLAVEAPLEVRLAWREHDATREQTVAITMRTPGNDRELAVGFLFGEGILRQASDVASCDVDGSVVRLELAPGAKVDLRSLDRNSYVTSSCGVCGKTSLDAVRVRTTFAPSPGPCLDPRVIVGLPDRLRSAQPAFDSTGGIHAAGLFDAQGALILSHEDVGRHNAVDKVIGAALLARRVPLADHVLMLSGRASFELLQKATIAGVPVVAAVGAPSSLAVDLAREAGVTLLGFVREGRFNIYTGPERVQTGRAASPGRLPVSS
jgi:FdhD protein